MCDQVPTPGRRLVNGQIQTLANRLHISPSKIIRRANIGPTISTQRLGCSRWPNLGRTLACQLRRSTNHANHVPTLDQRLVADWDVITCQIYFWRKKTGRM
jgi:DNA-binding MurR/RpiR family transcriptional regulator